MSLKNFKYLLFLTTLLFAQLSVMGQLQVNQQNAQTLVENVLVGTGVTVQNIQFIGDNQQIGFFNGANSNIGLSSGIIMSTGRIQDAIGPNNEPNAGENLFRPGYIPLANLLGGNVNTFDAAVLSFNFRCEGDNVSFKYVFASEEYPEYVGSEFNDIFAFFIQGPGIAGQQNIARIPGTNLPVTINNVNQNGFSNFYVNNGNGTTSGGTSVQFDGFTRPFVAEATVIPCEWYTIIMAITDVSDAIFDSGVFLEASSFSSPEVTIEQQPSYIDGGTELYENCGFNRITFNRSGDVSDALTIDIEFAGTATFGVDYNQVPLTLTFLPGQSEIFFDLVAVNDNIAEPGGETVQIIYRDESCDGEVLKIVEFTIFDPPPLLQIDAGSTQSFICPRLPTPLNATVTGGVGPYLIAWNGFLGGNPVTAFPDSSTYYYASVTDQCGTVITDSVLIVIEDYTPLRLISTNDTVVCRGDKARIGGYATGGRLPIMYFWNDNLGTLPYLEIAPNETTNYTLTIIDSCGITISKEIVIQVVEVDAKFNVNYLDQTTVQFEDLSSEDSNRWYWDFGDEIGTSEVQNPLYTYQDTGTYWVTLIVANELACTDTVTNPVKAFPPFTMFIPNAFTPDGDGINDLFYGKGEGYVTYEMSIFNRWGELIFYTDEIEKPWGMGGRDALSRIQNDVYTYRIIIGLPTREQKTFIGRVTVIR